MAIDVASSAIFVSRAASSLFDDYSDEIVTSYLLDFIVKVKS